MYISEGVFVVEASDAELKKIKGEETYEPKIGDEIDIVKSWDAWLWIKSKKPQITQAGENLVNLAKKL